MCYLDSSVFFVALYNLYCACAVANMPVTKRPANSVTMPRLQIPSTVVSFDSCHKLAMVAIIVPKAKLENWLAPIAKDSQTSVKLTRSC